MLYPEERLYIERCVSKGELNPSLVKDVYKILERTTNDYSRNMSTSEDGSILVCWDDKIIHLEILLCPDEVHEVFEWNRETGFTEDLYLPSDKAIEYIELKVKELFTKKVG
jgi:hypothetical protein